MEALACEPCNCAVNAPSLKEGHKAQTHRPAGTIPVNPNKVPVEVPAVFTPVAEVIVAVPTEPEEAGFEEPAVMVPKGAATGVDVLVTGATAAEGNDDGELRALATLAWWPGSAVAKTEVERESALAK